MLKNLYGTSSYTVADSLYFNIIQTARKYVYLISWRQFVGILVLWITSLKVEHCTHFLMWFVLTLELVRFSWILNSIKESKKSTFSDNEKHIKVYTFYYINIVFLMTYSESAKKKEKENKSI